MASWSVSRIRLIYTLIPERAGILVCFRDALALAPRRAQKRSARFPVSIYVALCALAVQAPNNRTACAMRVEASTDMAANDGQAKPRILPLPPGIWYRPFETDALSGSAGPLTNSHADAASKNSISCMINLEFSAHAPVPRPVKAGGYRINRTKFRNAFESDLRCLDRRSRCW